MAVRSSTGQHWLFSPKQHESLGREHRKDLAAPAVPREVGAGLRSSHGKFMIKQKQPGSPFLSLAFLTVLDPPLNSSLPSSLLPMTAEVQVCTDLHTFDKHILTHWLVH